MKLFRYFIIYRFAKDAVTAAKIYQLLYHSETLRLPTQPKQTTNKSECVEAPTKKPSSKKEEIIQSLKYLKSKKNPSKQEKDSIYTLEMVLKNMK